MRFVLKTCFLFFLCFGSCKNSETKISQKIKLDPLISSGIAGKMSSEEKLLQKQQAHPLDRMQFKLIESKIIDKAEIFSEVKTEIDNFPLARYNSLKPLILEQDIPTLQQHIADGTFTYTELTLFYLKRIANIELDSSRSLHSIIALNPNAIAEAKKRDANKTGQHHPIYGMPILLKDNINTKDMKTTAGAAALKENQPLEDAFIVSRLKANGAIILGKANLSEWAYYFCQRCPLGYSAVGGQTLNPYGIREFETGGSSAGSGTATAANYAIAAIGTETAGSIISPSSQNALVGLKPTPGVLSRTGIVPISHTLDTPGPMAKSVVDASILMDAMRGEDVNDYKSVRSNDTYLLKEKNDSFMFRFGVIKDLLEEPLYAAAVAKLKASGIEVIEIEPERKPLDGFSTLLNLEMKEELPKYLKAHASKNISLKNLAEIMTFNRKDSIVNMPYNQGIFDGIMADTTSVAGFELLRKELLKSGNAFFEETMKINQLDAILSINNYHSAYAAVGLRPCLAIPMGLKTTGEPMAITLIANLYEEAKLLRMGLEIEQVLQARVPPADYR